jgi:hypothetical protein
MRRVTIKSNKNLYSVSSFALVLLKKKNLFSLFAEGEDGGGKEVID